MITVAGLTKRYGDVLAVDDLSFTVEPGAVTGFLGANGAGKSTTMRMILGLDAPTAGTATIGGRRYRDLEHPVRTVGALLDPRCAHPGRTGRDHLRWMAVAAGIGRVRVDEVLEAVGLAGAADRRVGGYSLGMRQRLGIAGALLGDPEVVLLDEPLNGLDPDGIRWVRELLRGLAAQGRTVFVSSHLLNEVEHTAERVVVIGHGRLIATGAIADLLGRTAVLRVTAADPVETAELATALAWAGGRVEPDGDGLTVRGLAAETAGRIALDRGIALRELATHVRGLEETFHALAHGGAA
ncbi:ABC-2 type transport system ATP-binding protein [Pseudonocardia thermophila]|uniref:ABC-2 type transport system ATP-binding protein n=1 Tax=Pseudonocardia thermophila TaxID=1848 RepID=A0A1M7A4S5_PSETH|nr:ABC transporter ATP-binding protein [Pseudonocardia thermophila]SHL37619.1 ABC-2 type transport system ATP-binding protein [Pseudonocardia thermophila]